MKLPEQLVSRVFYDRNYTHTEHWKTTSYAQHQTYADFYNSIVPVLDQFVEARQGLLGKLDDVQDHKPTINNPTPLNCLIDNMKFISNNRGKLCENVEALENILDEMVGLYLKTIYKLKSLK